MMDGIIQAAKERADRDLSRKREIQNHDKLDQVIKTQEFILQEIKEIKRQLLEMKKEDSIKEF